MWPMLSLARTFPQDKPNRHPARPRLHVRQPGRGRRGPKRENRAPREPHRHVTPSASNFVLASSSSSLAFLLVELEAIVRQKDAELQSCTCKRTAALTPTQSTHALTPSPIGTSFGDTSPLSTTETFDKRSGYALAPAAPYPDPPVEIPSVRKNSCFMLRHSRQHLSLPCRSPMAETSSSRRTALLTSQDASSPTQQRGRPK